MNVYQVKGYATIDFGNGVVSNSDLYFNIATKDIIAEVERIKANPPKGVKVNNFIEHKLVGEKFFVTENKETSFMGIKFPKNSITDVTIFNESSLSIYFMENGKREYASIGYGHLLRTDQKVVLDKFFADLTYTK